MPENGSNPDTRILIRGASALGRRLTALGRHVCNRLLAHARSQRNAIDGGAFHIGEQAGVPLHRFDLDDTPAAHDAVEGAAVGKVLIMVSD